MTKTFSDHVVEGDFFDVDLELDGMPGCFVRAKLFRDPDSDKPDERQDGFWPSKDPNDAGYVKPSDFDEEMEKATNVFEAWERDEWFYCGIVLQFWADGICLLDHAASLWGIEANYPGSDNSYLNEVVHELMPEARTAGAEKLKALSALINCN